MEPRSISFEIAGEAVPFARAGANGKRRYTPKKQMSFMEIVKEKCARAMADLEPFKGPVQMDMIAVYLIPASWPKGRRESAKWKASKPDLDNLAKLTSDAMNRIVYVDDAQIAHLSVKKVYGHICRMTVTITEL